MTERGNGYIPHSGMGYFKCPRCGSETFKDIPQGIPYESEIWTFEYKCAGCGKIMGLTVIRRG